MKSIRTRTFSFTGPQPFDPLPADHPLVYDETYRCPGCEKEFKPGEITTLLTIGPGSDPEARRRARTGRAYNAVAVPAHWACVTGIEED